MLFDNVKKFLQELDKVSSEKGELEDKDMYDAFSTAFKDEAGRIKRKYKKQSVLKEMEEIFNKGGEK